MPQDTPAARRLNPNQVVAHNLARARALRGVTQEQATERLEPFLGERWSQAVISAAERSVGGKRVREFDANVVHAFARAFQLPISFFHLPPDADTFVGIDGAPGDPAGPFEQIVLATWVSTEVRERIDVLTRALPAADRARLIRDAVGDPGGVREGALVSATVARIKPQLEQLAAELQAQIEVLDALAHEEEAGDDQVVEEMEVDPSRARAVPARVPGHVLAGNKPQG